jgi:hypothetical protein
MSVAIIAVHGVADQQAGATARAIVDLLVASAPPGVSYRGVSSEDLTIPVPPLAPKESCQRPDAAPQVEEHSGFRAFVQSVRSDFQRASWQAPRRLRSALWRPGGAGTRTTVEPDVDRGIAVSNYLLTKHRDNGARQEPYQTTRVELERTDAQGGKTAVSVHEMYWADLSRLSGAIPRIVSELFTMMFRISKLGRETVDEAWGAMSRRRATGGLRARFYGAAWACVGSLQIAMDWLFVNVLALLFMQLGLMGAMLITLGLAGQVRATALHDTLAALLALGAVMRLAWLRTDGTAAQTGRAIAVLAVALGAVAWPPLAPWLTGLTLLLAITLVNEAFLRVADERFPFVHAVGRWLWFVTVMILLASVIVESAWPPQGMDWRQAWTHAVLFTTEVDLLAIKWWWIIAGGLLILWFFSGLVAGREGGYEARGSIATGRFAVAVSFGMFLAVAMTIWALLETTLASSVEGVGYAPCIFVLQDRHPERDTYPANACLWTTRAADESGAYPNPTGVPRAERALHDRYLRSTTAFSSIAALLVMLVAYLATIFTPSVLAELKLLAEHTRLAFRRTVERRSPARLASQAAAARSLHARRLGRWLTTGLRHIDGAVLFITLVGVVAGTAVSLLFIDSIAPFAVDHALVRQVERGASHSAQFLLKPLIFTAAGAGATLWLLGGVLSRYVPPLRAPLDVALDVDNHFREFPRSNIARAHIFSRYAALLSQVASQGHDRIVLVAHSQGTVISADLLRFLASDGEHEPEPGARPRIAGHELPPINLLTVGSPLRQLYAARFPGLYGWVLKNNGDTFGPLASDLGVQRWMNGFCSGDYVGRWLWSGATHDEVLRHPMATTLGPRSFGRDDVYGGFQPEPPLEATLRAAREVEVCLGTGAHTHYFEHEQGKVAWMIDYLVRADAIDQGRAAAVDECPVPVSIDATAV